MILSVLSGNGRCSAFASSQGPRIQTSRSSSVARDAEPADRNLFWHDCRRRLGRMSRLTLRAICQIEAMVAERIPKPGPVPQKVA
jgi:hypothetical protein